MRPNTTPMHDAGVSRERLPSGARKALVVLSLAVLLSSLGTSIANVALPTFAEVFGASMQQVQWVVLAYLLAITTLIVSVGRLGDMIGQRRLLVTGIAVFTLASVLCGLAPSLWLLVAARAVQGLGAAAMMALAIAMVGEIVPKAHTGSAMGLLGTMSAIGTALGPSLGGVLIAGLGWRAIFLAGVPLGLAAWALAIRTLPADALVGQGRRVRLDIPGTLLLAATLAAYALAMTWGRGSFGPVNMTLLVLATLGLAGFLAIESRVAAPLVRLAMLREPALRAGLSSGLLVATVMMATLVVGPFYLSRALALDAATVGLVMSIGPAISALAGVPAGRIVDRLGASSAVTVGLCAMLAGATALTTLPAYAGVAGYVAAIAVLTPGYQLFQAANNTAVMADVPPDRRGVVSGLANLSRNLGLVTGASLMGAVFTVASGAADVMAAAPDAVSAGMQVTFGVAAGLVVMALAVTRAGRRG